MITIGCAPGGNTCTIAGTASVATMTTSANIDGSGMMDGFDAFQQQALGVLSSSKFGRRARLHQGALRVFASVTAPVPPSIRGTVDRG